MSEKNKKNLRKIKNLLPAVFQTDVNEKFFSSSVDQVFQPQNVEELLCYIGKITSWYDHRKDFYIKEKDLERQFYQLSPFMFSKDLKTKDYVKQLSYTDLINYLRFKGGIVNNHQRLFETDYYSWCPPIDLDKFMNYRNYYWVPLGPKPVEIDVLTDLDNVKGLENYSINNNGNIINFSSGLRIKPKNDVNNYYNGRVFIVEGVGRGIILVEDFLSAYGWDLNLWDTVLWDEIGDLSFVPDYITIERGAEDKNLWSLSNRWFHRDVITNFFDPNLFKIRASRPIIEFERNIELWNYGAYNRGHVDIVVDNCENFFNLINGRQPGMPVGPPAKPGGLPTIGCGIEVDEPTPIWPLSHLGYSQIFYTDSDGNKLQLRDGLLLLMPVDNNSFIKNKILKITGIKDFNKIILQVVNNGLNISGDPEYDERVLFRTLTGKKKTYRYDGEKWIEGQNKKSINQPPLFQLYDTENRPLDDENYYPESDFKFKGNKIFSYKEDDNFAVDKVLNMKVKKNNLNEFVFENNLYTDRYFYVDQTTKEILPINGYYFYKITDYIKNEVKYLNNWITIPTKSSHFYVYRYDNHKGISEFVLTLKPSLPLKNRNNTETKSLLVKINNKEKELGIDYSYNFVNNKITLNKPLEEGEILEIYVVSEETPPNNQGIYEIPTNLQSNPNNEEITEVGINQLFEHFYNNIKYQKNISGNIFGRNNYRDTKKEKIYGNKILQHDAPLLRLMLIASDRDLDLVDAIRYVRREYVRFRNKFIKKISSLNLTNNNPADWFENALRQINLGKNEESPFRNSGVGYDLVPSPTPTYMPPSPAYLGITKVYKPEIYVDDTYSSPINVLRCHDGSLIPLFGDFRDQVLLYYEQKIYDSIPQKFKNDYLPLLSEYDVIPGKFRKTEYSLQEINSILQNSYELWLVDNNINDTKNNYLETFEEKSINYTNSFDYTNEQVYGSWRSLFMWFYDTDTPHLTPWEMLGFGKKPDWWDSEYGPAPYTSGNFKLWDDLRQGLIRQGPRAGYDKRFERPDLLDIIPVDSTGSLKTPLNIGLVKEKPSDFLAGRDWKFGEYGPVETIWRKSSEFVFDMTIMLFLSKPARFSCYNWDTLTAEYIHKNDTRQFVFNNYKKRTKNIEEVVHGETKYIVEEFAKDYDFEIYDNVVRRYGYQQFIADYLKNKGKDTTLNFGNYLRGLGVTLGYRASGFTDPNYTFIESESFGRLPKENYKVKLYNSNSLREIFYGGVIIEKTATGYKVYGYDVVNPYFKVIPSDIFGKKVKIGIGTKEISFKEWNKNTHYYVGDIVTLNNNRPFYQCIADHISGESFDFSKWKEIKTLQKEYEISAIKYLDGKFGEEKKILYGSEFSTVQEVFNFLIEYERYLKKEGFVFDNYNFEVNENIDFTWSGKEFLSWVLLKPIEGEILTLSPMAEKVKFSTDFGKIAPVEDIIQNVYSILNRSGVKIDPKDTIVTRLDDFIEVTPYNINNQDTLIYAIRFYITSVEHVYLLDNKTIFDDTIYDPLFNIKVDRLRINLVRVADWKGRYEAAGYIINNDTLLPNFDKLVDQIRYIFDTENSNLIEKRWRDYGYHLIGYQPRNYLNNLIISDKSQLNFYQGMIRQKGTKSSLQKLLRSEYINKISDMLFYEEWLFRIGHYGNYEKTPSLEIIFKRDDFKENPVTINLSLEELPHFVEVGTSAPSSYQQDKFFFNKNTSKLYVYDVKSSTYKELTFDDFINYFLYNNPYDNILRIPSFTYDGKIVGSSNKWLLRPDRNVSTLKNWLFPLRKSEHFNFNELPNAGYVKLDEYTHSVFNVKDLASLYNEKIKNKSSEIKDGDRIWVYDNSLNLNSKFNQPLNNFYDSWSIYRISKYSRKTRSISRKNNDDIAVSFVYSELFPVSANNRFELNIDQISYNDILVSYEENENKTKLNQENFKIYGYVYDVNVTALSIVSGQTIVVSYSDENLPNSLVVTEFNEYTNGSHIFKTQYVPNELESISYGYISSASATYVGNLTAFTVFVSSVVLTGESVWISYSPIFENIEGDRIYTEKFVSDGINNTFQLTFLPNISSIKVRKGFETKVSADKYLEEKNPFIEVSSNAFDKIWVEYVSRSDDESYIELFEKTSSNQLIRIKEEPYYDSVNVYVGSARETVFLNPVIDFIVSGLNTIIVNASAPKNSNIFVNYLIKDPKTENKPINHFTGNGINDVFNLSDPVLSESDILVFVDGKLQYNVADYTVSSNSTSLKFNNAPDVNSKIWVYYVSKTVNNYDQIILSGQVEFPISLSGISTYGCLLSINNEILKPEQDYIVSGNKVHLTQKYPLNSVVRIRYINPVPAIKEKDIVLFDYSNIEDFVTIEGFREVKSVNQLGELIFENNTTDFTVFSDEKTELNQPKNVYVLKEIRFIDYEDYFNTVNSVYFGSIFSKPRKGEILYIDDARLKDESNKEKYYRVFSLPGDGWLSVVDEKDIIANTKRVQKNKVDTSLIYNAEIYDSETKNVVTAEVYDPYKGIIPGIADREIFYKLDYDPAIYNTGDSSVHNVSNIDFWGREQVGRVWWDLRTVRFIDYEIDEIDYRRSNWGRTAPGTSVDVYEWTRSDMPPSEYNAVASQESNSSINIFSDERPSGVTYHQENTPYTVLEEYDRSTGQIKKYYYFWVKNKITVPNVGFRSLSVFDIAKIIENPTQRGILWFSPVCEDSLIVANAFDFLNNTTSLKVNWVCDKETNNKGNFHKQWLLGREHDPNWIIDDFLYRKFVDSLVGYNISGEEVPDPNLKEYEKYGNLVRPRQSWFKNRSLAVFNFVELVNKIFEQINLSLKLNGFSDLYVYDKEPDADFVVNDFNQRDYIVQTNAVSVGQTILVNKNLDTKNFWTLWKLTNTSPVEYELVEAQKYDTSDFIELTDFYDKEVNKNLIPEKIYNNTSERNAALAQGLILENETIYVRDVAGFWEWQKYEKNSFRTVARQQSTIKLSKKFYSNNIVYGIKENWKTLSIEELNYKIKNRDGRLELRKLLEIFKNNYFDSNETLNQIFFSSVRYALSENKANDWVIKSSYVLFGGLTEFVTQEEILRPNLFESIYDYLIEIKPYHTKFRDFYRRISSSLDEYSLKVSDYDYNTDVYDPEKTRKIHIKQNFDRVSCDISDDEPLIIRIVADGSKSNFVLDVNNTTITTFPNNPNYEVYKKSGVQIWSKDNIEYVVIKNNEELKSTVLKDDDWNISEIQQIKSSGSSSFTIKSLQLSLSLIPKNGEIVEIKRKIFAADRIERYYQVVTTLINNKPVQHIIPEKSSKLISGCDFKGTQVEGGAYINSVFDFQATINGNKLENVWDLQPDINYIENNILPASLPNGGSLEEFVSANGIEWLNIYYDMFSSVYPNDPLIIYLNNFYSSYSWDVNQWDGEENTTASDYSSTILSSGSSLYDSILESGTQLSGFPGYSEYTSTPSHWPTAPTFDPLATIVEGNKFVQPYMGPNRPEELVLNRYFDPLIIDNYLRELPGAAKVKEFKYKGIINTGFEIDLNIVPQSRESIFLFINGRLLDENTDYVVDWRNQKIIYVGPPINDNSTQLLLKIYSTGGNRLVHTEYLRVSDATTGTYGYTINTHDLEHVLLPENIFGTIDGYIVSAVNVVNGEIIFDLSGVSVSADSNVIINIYDSSDIIKIRTTKYVVASGLNTIYLYHKSGSEIPSDQSVLVFLSGFRLHGPDHEYFTGDGINNYFNVDTNLSSYSSFVYINNSLKVSGLDYTLAGANDDIINFVDVPNKDEKITVLINNGEYLINSSGNVVLTSPVSGTSTFKVITFNENRLQGLRTEKFEGNSSGKYGLDLIPFNNNVYWASVNGENNVYGIHFQTYIDSYGYDQDMFGIQDFGEGPYYVSLDFNTDHSGMSVYITYSTENEKTDPLTFRMFRPLYDEKEDIRITNNNILYLKTEISANTTSFDVYENYKYLYGLRNIIPLNKPDPYNNSPGVIWVNGERIEYWKLSETKYDSENNRYWTISSIVRRTKETSRGTEYKKETYWFAGDNSTTVFNVPTTLTLSANNVLVTIYDNILIDNLWDDAHGWDISPHDSIPENIEKIILNTKTSSSNSSLYFEISANNIIFSQPIPESNLNPILLDVSSSSMFYPVKNIKVDVINYDWKTSKVEHSSGSVVFNGNITEQKPLSE